jgi:hypothetical protein
MNAVPGLIGMTQDDSASATTKQWAFQALGAITGETFGTDSTAWQEWWVNRVQQ